MFTFRTDRNSLTALSLCLASVLSPSLHATPADDIRDADFAFSSGFELFYAGPQWFLNALPGSRRAHTRYLDRAGDVVESTRGYDSYAGTLHDVFDVSLFNNISFFGRTTAGKTFTPALAAATPPDYYWDVNGAAAGLGGTGIWDAGATPNWNNSTGTGAPTVWVDGNNAIFGGTAGIVTLNSPVTARSLLFSVNGYAIIGSGTLTLTNSGSGGPGPATIEVQNGVASIGTTISGTAGLTKSGAGLLILGGVNNYTGDTTIKAGELFLAASGSLSSSSTIRLGDASVNSPSAMFTFGDTSGGETVSNPMTVQASASGTEGKRTILGLAISGDTNTYSGVITLNTDLTVQSAAVGSTVANGQGTLLFQGGSIDVMDNAFKVDSNLRLNNADTYSIQGIVRINEVLGSSLATGGSVVKDGSGTLILQGTNNTYTGTDASNLNASGTTIRGGILGIFGDGSLGLAPTSATNNVFFTTSAFNVNGDSIRATLRADAPGIILAPTRSINIASGVTARFDSNGNTFTIAGNINGTNGNLNKIGPGTLVLTGANTYTGTTTVSNGTLNAAAPGALGGTTGEIRVNNGGTLMVSGTGNLNRINNTTPIVLGGGAGFGNPTFERSGTGIVSEGIGAQRTGPLPINVTGTSSAGLGALSLQSNATFNFGTDGIGTFVFGTFTSNGNMLTILNWTSSNADVLAQTSGIDGTDDRLIFTGAPTDIGFINFNGTPATFILLDTGFYEVVPVPEPSTWIGGALALAAIGFTQRRRLRGRVTRRA